MTGQRAATVAVHQDPSAVLASLLHDDKLGPIRWFECTQVICFSKQEGPFNVYTLYSGESGPVPAAGYQFLGERFSLPGIDKDRRFGLVRHRIPTQQLIDALSMFAKTGVWSTGGKPLQVAPLTPLPRIFCPPDGTERVPLNSLLKNNFLNGSHILELADAEKATLGFLLQAPGALTELSKHCSQVMHLGLDAAGDRVGNIVIQLPVTALVAKFRTTRDDQLTIALEWHPECQPRRVRGSFEVAFDGTIEAYGSRTLITTLNEVATERTNRGTRAWVWDEENELILAAMSRTTTMGGGLVTSTVMVQSENRVILDLTSPGTTRRVDIPVWDGSPAAPQRAAGGILGNQRWADLRIYRSGLARLETEREFVQYAGVRSGGSQRSKALADIHFLIQRHGAIGTYLWDPYLSAADVLATLAHNPFGGADLRALTSGKSTGKDEPPVAPAGATSPPTPNPSSSRRQRWQTDQATHLDTHILAKASLRLEFRIQHGTGGWAFHDRFLLFPSTSGEHTRVWSLGISVNQIGEEHHILQEVSNPQPVMDAFNELWSALQTSEFLIWKTP